MFLFVRLGGGFIRVKESMKSLGHKIRSNVAKESIKRLCQASNILLNNGTHYLDRGICDARILDDKINIKQTSTVPRFYIMVLYYLF